MHQLRTNTLFACTLALFNWIALSDSTQATPTNTNNPTHYKTREGCICPFVYIPVCGTDGKTYGNGCELECAQRNGNYVLGVCKGECPCCKPPYHNDPFPVELPEQIVGGEGGGSGWGWRNRGSNYGRWNSGSRSPFYPSTYSYPRGNVNYVLVDNRKDEDMDAEEVASKLDIAQEPVAGPVPKEVAKSTSPMEDNKDAKPIKPEKQAREAQSVKNVAVVDDTDSEGED